MSSSNPAGGISPDDLDSRAEEIVTGDYVTFEAHVEQRE